MHNLSGVIQYRTDQFCILFSLYIIKNNYFTYSFESYFWLSQIGWYKRNNTWSSEPSISAYKKIELTYNSNKDILLVFFFQNEYNGWC